MSLEPLISICIPTFERPAFLREALASALSQSYQPVEVLVGDDSRDERTAALIAAHPERARIAYEHHPRPLGQAGNINRLFDRASGDRLIVLHDDDTLTADAVEVLASAWSRAPHVTACFAKQYVMNEAGVREEDPSARLNADYGRVASAEGVIDDPVRAALLQQLPGAGYLMRTDIARRVRQSTDPTVGVVCDFEFGLRLAAAATAFAFVDRYVYCYRDTRLSASSTVNASRSTYAVLQRAIVPAHLEAIRRQQLAELAPRVVVQELTEGDAAAARAILRSRAYPARALVTPAGLASAVLALLPGTVGRRILASARRLRARAP